MERPIGPWWRNKQEKISLGALLPWQFDLPLRVGNPENVTPGSEFCVAEKLVLTNMREAVATAAYQ